MNTKNETPAQIELCPDLPVPAKKCWSADGEVFDAQSLGELIDAADLEPGDIVFFGDQVTPDPAKYITESMVDCLLEQMDEEAFSDRCDSGNDAENYPDASSDAKQELVGLLHAWARKHCAPKFWIVENISRHEITEQDLE